VASLLACDYGIAGDGTAPYHRRMTTPPPLTDDDVVTLRARLDAGEKPRVVVRAASAAVAAGTRGNVVRLGDPKDSEYIVVRLGRDEVPFGPSELGIPGRKPEAAPRPAAKRAPTKRLPAKQTATKRVPPMVVTMRFRDGGWSVEAQRGARRLSNSTALRPGAVSAFAEHLEDGELRDALVETVDACRAVVEQEAAALRAELERAEAALAAYDAKPGKARK
jgi:Family of unknown function (DUF6319)